MAGEGDALLKGALEELQVAEEGLRQQNEELLAARAALEQERRRYQDLYDLAPEGYVVTDLRGVIREANCAASALLGVDARALAGKPLALFILRDDLPAFYAHVAVIDRGSGTREWETRLQPRGSPPCSVSVRVAPRDCGCEQGFCLRWILHDVTERKRAEDAVRDLNCELERRVQERTAQLQALDRAKDLFMAMLAHELRNPLGAILNAARVLREPDLDPASRARARDIIERQVRLEARLVEDLLNTTRIVHGKIELQREHLDLAALVCDVAEGWGRVMREGGLQLELRAPDGPLWIDGDPARLTQVLENLLQNAAKFTRPGGTVRVDVAGDLDRGCVTVAVSDTGVGIDAAVLPTVFDAFAQADRTLDRSRGGLGLGLTVVRHLVELHGGTVSARSAGPDRGATFTFSLPLPEQEGPRTPTPEAGRRGGMAEGHGLRVLIIEDNPDAAGTLSDVLGLSGHETHVAYSGTEGIAAARSCPPAAVLCDLGLPGMDGYAVARALRGEPATASSLLVAVSGYGGDEDRRRSRDAGFDHHLVKPIDFALLDRVLSEASARPGAAAAGA